MVRLLYCRMELHGPRSSGHAKTPLAPCPHSCPLLEEGRKFHLFPVKRRRTEEGGHRLALRIKEIWSDGTSVPQWTPPCNNERASIVTCAWRVGQGDDGSSLHGYGNAGRGRPKEEERRTEELGGGDASSPARDLLPGSAFTQAFRSRPRPILCRLRTSSRDCTQRLDEAPSEAFACLRWGYDLIDCNLIWWDLGSHWFSQKQ